MTVRASYDGHALETVETTSIAYTETQVTGDDDTVQVIDDFCATNCAFPATISDSETFTYSETFTCSSDTSEYSNSVIHTNYPNEASLSGTAMQTKTDNANVNVSCYVPSLQKTAVGTYNRVVDWILTKSVNPASHKALAGQNTELSTWTVEATKSNTYSNYEVTGTISITNPNPSSDLLFTIADSLSDGTVATVTCPDMFVAAGGVLSCDYTAEPLYAGESSGAPNENTATLQISGSSFETSATTTISYIETLTGDDSVVFNDGRCNTCGAFLTIDSSRTFVYTETFLCSSNPSDYTSGVLTTEYSNLATITSTETDLSAEASVSVECCAPVLSKDASGSYDERHDWDVTKTVDGPDNNPWCPGEQPSWTWKIEVTETVQNQNFAVVGTINVVNPTGSPEPMSVSLYDELDDGTVAQVTCASSGTGTISVNPGDTEVCVYTATPTSATASQNTATGTFNGISFAASVPVTFSMNVVNDGAVVTDTKIGLNGQAVTQSTTFESSESETCSGSYADYTTAGTYTVNLINTATLVDDEGQQYSSTATTSYTCEAGTVTLQKYTNGVVDPTLSWQFTLSEGTTVIATDTTFDKTSGLLNFGNPALCPGTTYTICESAIPAGYTVEWQGDGGVSGGAPVAVIPFVPGVNTDPVTEPAGYSNVYDPNYVAPPETYSNDVRCVDFVVDVGETKQFDVNNQRPGGEPRTIGFWKNWNTCTNGNQAETADKNGGPDNGFYILNDLLADPGYTLGLLELNGIGEEVCLQAVNILDKRDVVSGKKRASDAAFGLAAQYLASLLNDSTGAETCQAIQDARTEAQALLLSINFNGEGKYLRTGDALYADTVFLASVIDDYNNGILCD